MRSAVHGAVARPPARSLLSPLPIRPGSRPLDETIRAASGSGYVALGTRVRRGPPDPPASVGPRRRRTGMRRGGRSRSSGSSPTRRSPTRCRPRGWTSWTRRAARSSPRGGRRRRSGLQVFDQVVRNLNANRTSEIRDGSGKRAKLGFVDHHRRPGRQPAAQRDALVQDRARRRDGRSVLRQGDQRDQPVRDGRRTTVAALNAAVAARQYTGVADYDDYRGVAGRALQRLLGPGRGAAGAAARTPRSRAIPGLLERAQQPFTAAGLEGAVVHRPRQPRRARAGQRARERRTSSARSRPGA